jgi:dipeptidyl aminopeptidase/acylaminoacyl peptidase
VADAAGENAVRLTNFGGPIAGTPRWSPDGQRIAFDARPDGNSDICIVSVAGGKVTQLTQEPGSDDVAAWSYDGKRVYFSSDRSGRFEIWYVPASGGEAVQVTRNGGRSVVASPDGRWLYYRRSGPQAPIYRIHSDGSDDAEVVPENVLLLNYTTTSSGLWFVRPPGPTRSYWSLQERRFSDGNVREVRKLDFRPDILNLSLSPDQRYALVTRPDPRGTDLLLVENFR